MFITRLAESPAVSEQTIRSLAGHVSKRMLERYSHMRNAAKTAAIETLEAGSEGFVAVGWVQTLEQSEPQGPGLGH